MDTIRQQLRIRADHHRPVYHYLPPRYWMNDPNGLIQWKGVYHLFYQHNPGGPLWGDMHWGHASSADLIHWTDLPIALAPTPGGPDEAGCFSGCAVDNNGVPTFIYTGTSGQHNSVQAQCVATSSDDLLTWQKYVGNPVLKEMPAITGQTVDFRDPYVWKEGDSWYMVVGSRIRDEQHEAGAVFLYRSDDLINWQYLKPLLTADKPHHGRMWECPNFFPLGDLWVLIISAHTGHTTDTVIYFVGTYEDHSFTPLYEGILDYDRLYAPLTFADDQSRRILIGWLREDRPDADQRIAGWSGVQSIPRLLSLDEQNRLIMQPIPEIEAKRGQHYDDLGQINSVSLDIVAEFEPEGGCGFSVACSPETRESTDIVYDFATQQLAIRRTWPQSNGALTTHDRAVPHSLDAGESLQLRILLDGSVLEVMANGRTSISSRIYPSAKNSKQVCLIGTARSVKVWKMESIWESL